MIITSNQPQIQKRQREIIVMVVMCNFALAVLKLAIGLAGYTKLILIDGIFAFANGLMLLLMWPAYEMENREQDEQHPYGYGKILFVITFIVGVLFLVVSIYMYSYSLNNMEWEEIHRSHTAALMVSLISIAANAALYRYLKQEGMPHADGVLVWNSFNNLVAAISSVLILVFIILSSLGLFYMERIGVIAISIVLFMLSLRMLFKSSARIMDRAPSRKIIERIRLSAEEVEGVARIVEIKARHIGTYMYVDLSFIPEHDGTMREAGEIAHRIESKVARSIPFLSKEINAIVV